MNLNLSNLIIVCRNHEKGAAASASLIKQTGCGNRTSIEVWDVDLASYKSVLSFGARVRTQLPRLDAFIANAPVELMEFESAEGLELSLTVNVISTLLCGMAVLPKLRETAAKHETQTHLTFVGSSYHIFGPDSELEVPADVDVFETLSQPNTANMPLRYALSKMMLHQCHAEFAHAAAALDSGKHRVVVNIANPGWCKTELVRSKEPVLSERITFSLVGWSAEKGSRAVIYAAAMGEESYGRYVSECRLKPESEFVRSNRGRQIQKRVWKDLRARIKKISPEVASFIQ